MSKPPATITDGKTGKVITVNQEAPWDPISHFLCAMVSTIGIEATAAFIGLEREETPSA